MNRTIAEATVERLRSDSPDRLRPNRTDVPAPEDCARRRTTPNGLTPFGYIRNIRTPVPDRSTPIQSTRYWD
ncbi:hypothetical protein PARU111607_06355 [Palleronia rufa]